MRVVSVSRIPQCFHTRILVDSRIVPGLSATSQQDLTTNDLTSGRPPFRNSPGRQEESGDLDHRGRELAGRCWAEDEDFLPKDKIAEWLGGQYVVVWRGTSDRFDASGPCRSLINKAALRHYMYNFDFSNLRLDQAFRCVARRGAV